MVVPWLDRYDRVTEMGDQLLFVQSSNGRSRREQARRRVQIELYPSVPHGSGVTVEGGHAATVLGVDRFCWDELNFAKYR
ncbi:hypothetical protein ACFWPH_34545 [Nocardia sp. NPDC058499]|uniref:hypothetical protein n=1 Tax=Nocardia sp. NPDC058499 TaxID=3346530 RepID=UPI0036672A50